MKSGSTVQLSQRERATITQILARARPRIGIVKVFGSRATGTARPCSDLDLVVFPPAPASELDSLREAFEESDLPIAVDVLAWDDIDHQPLREAITLHGLPFFNAAPETGGAPLCGTP